ncbi:MAG: 50S ribosomal protein L9 [Bacteroidales bacterium]
MQVILKEDVHNLGYKGDVVNVKKGYGRNYLIPQLKAVIASESALKMLAEDNRQRAHKLAKIKADAEARAAQVNGVSLKITTKASESGKVFGSVTTVQIADALSKKGIEIDRKTIVLKDPIKELGAYKIAIKMHKDVTAEIDVEVVAED